MKVPGMEVRKLSIPAVRRGSRVTVVSPASYPQPERLAAGVEALGRLGYAPAVGRHALAKAHHYFAGTEQARLDDLHAAFLDPMVAAAADQEVGAQSQRLFVYLAFGPNRTAEQARHQQPLAYTARQKQLLPITEVKAADRVAG